MHIRLGLLLCFMALSPSLPAFAASESVQLAHSRATLVSAQEALVAGKPLRVGLVLDHEPGWHSYWENPGEAGIPTTLNWQLPDGFSASAIDWPLPKQVREGPLLVHSYYGQFLLPVTLTVPDALDADSITLALTADWLVCKDICIPETAELSLTLPVRSESEASIYASMFETHDETKPKPLSEKGLYSIAGKEFSLSVPLAALGDGTITSAFFFPREQGHIVYSSEQIIELDSDTLTLTTTASDTAPSGNLTGFLAVTTERESRAFAITLAPAANAATLQDTPSLSFLTALLLALIGGVILNLMPCVLPVLSLKALAIVKKTGHERAHVAKLGVAYTLGILVSFAGIAAVLIGLQHGGEAVGWGYQMQSPVFVTLLVYLLFLVGLNLSGLFDLPVLLGAQASAMNDSSVRGSFATGVLATAVATPCTAPFMASALGLALTLPSWQAMLVFLSLGLGLALPFLLISFFPALLRFLPKPGAWMESFKQLLAFPMYGSAIWLLWVLALQTGADGVALALIGLLMLVLAIWMKRLFAPESRAYLPLALLLALLAVGYTTSTIAALDAPRQQTDASSHGIETVDYSKEQLAALRSQPRPVFLDATAAWCITCKVNAAVAIHTEASARAFRDSGTVLMIADWTRRNPEITELLKSFGYQGVPLYVYYAPGRDPVVLPQVLSEDLVIRTLTQQGEP
ncbi:MAG: protein-disulfide reductase DsbD family protein [Alphaproteobacteria bacterium]|nr:protein-disulfide reductase DsbD family protein [Alphaproteobacteria bacterium]